MKNLAIIILVLSWLLPNSLSAQMNLQSSPTLDYTQPKEYSIGGIRVEGVSYLDQNSLVSMTGLRIGDKILIPGEDIGIAIRKLWKQGLLGDVRIDIDKIEGEKVFLKLVLSERPRLARFEFYGIPKGQQNTLKDKVSLVRGRIVNDVIIKNAQTSIKQHYIKKGFRNVDVKIFQKKDTLLANSIRLDIYVDKGDKVRVDEIEIVGNEAISDKKLKRKLKKTKEHKGWNFYAATKFIPEEYKNDKQNLIAYYNKEGYRDAYIISDSVVKEDDRVKITLNVNEGNQYRYRNIIWTGNYLHSDTLLNSILGIRKGDVYNPEELQKRISYNPTGLDVTSLYMDDGYLFFNIQPVEVGVEGDSIDVEMRIFEGDQATINSVVVSGNDRTRDHVILREVYTVPGQKFSRSALLRTQQQLSQLGFFDPEQIGINPIPNPSDGTVDIHYSVVEKPNDQIELSGGWGGSAVGGFIGTLGLTFNNFSTSRFFDFDTWSPLPQGDGQQVSVRFQASGRQFQTYSLSFMEPWLGGKKPNSFSVSLQHSVQNRINFRTGDNLGRFTVSGLTVALGRRLRVPDNYFQLSNSLSFLRYGLNDYNIGFRGIDNGVFNNFVFNTTISRSNVDSPIYPRSGSTLSLSVGLTPPYSSFRDVDYQNGEAEDIYRFIEYHKWMFDNSWFTPVVGDLVFSARAHMGFIGSYNRNVPISPFERFILGGAGLGFGNLLLGSDIIALRGYPDQEVTPPSEFANEGGVVYNKFVAELRYPVTLNQAASIFVLAFAEGGNNWGSFQSFQPFDLKRSAGVGARIFMPAFGLLGIDWAYGFDKLPGQSRRNGAEFHFTIGQQIR